MCVKEVPLGVSTMTIFKSKVLEIKGKKKNIKMNRNIKHDDSYF